MTPFDKAPFDPEKTHQDWQKLQERILLQEGNRPVAGKRIRPYWYAAAAVLLLLTAVTVIWQISRSGLQRYQTNYGQFKELQLPDGSRVRMNANSHLSFDEDWEKEGVREVWLEGEAFFHVSKQLKAGRNVKFIVHTGGLNIEVLGTRFNVKQRQEETRVTLTEGRVRVDAADAPEIIMRPGEQLAFSRKSKEVKKHRVEVQKYTAWTKGKLLLDHKTLAEAAVVIRETYGKEVVFENDRLKEIMLSGSYPLNDMDKLLFALEAAAQVEISLDNDRILFNEK